MGEGNTANRSINSAHYRENDPTLLNFMKFVTKNVGKRRVKSGKVGKRHSVCR